MSGRIDLPDGNDLPSWVYDKTGLALDPSISFLRSQQMEAIDWAIRRPEPYLFVNAPTGSGKTLIAGVFGAALRRSATYAVHTIRLQEQVAKTFVGVPVLTGRRNHPCWVGEQVYGVKDNYTADKGVCAVTATACSHAPKGSDDGYRGEGQVGLCPYYSQLGAAMGADFRVTNYAMFLSLPPVRERTYTLLADEGHNVEDAVTNQTSIEVNRFTAGRFKVRIPEKLGADLGAWAQWADKALKTLPIPAPDAKPDFGLKGLTDNLKVLAKFTPTDEGKWLVGVGERGVSFQPIWGRDFVMKNLFGHDEPPPGADVYEHASSRAKGVRKVLFTSATLMGADYIASTLGLPDGSWAYLDLPSTFHTYNRPINFSPVVGIGAKSSPEDYAKMQAAIDGLIEFYVLNGRPSGMIHAVSNQYRDKILTSSRFRGIMRSDPVEHEEAVKRGEGSVLVSANLTEGWDGVDNLCRFVIMPKVPFPSLGDQRTKIRKEEDARSYDHKALVAVVQGAGRGVRHKEDYADTWILDNNWRHLYLRRKDWLPDSFTSAYNHNVQLPF